MNARDLYDKMDYMGMERNARRILIEEKKIGTPEEIAMMTGIEVCDKLLKKYEVVACEHEKIIIVERENLTTYNDITKILSR